MNNTVSKEKQLEPSSNNIVAVIITYNPEGDFVKRLNRVRDQVAYTIIVDNCSSAGVREMLHKLESSSVEIIENSHNLGLAKALNLGVQRAVELGFAWSLTLDQDTVIDSDMVSSLVLIYPQYQLKESIGIISPNFRSKYSGSLLIDDHDVVNDFIESKTVVTSGSLMSNRAYQHVGPFRDDFFIEGIDLEYCLRLHKYGYKVLLSSKPLMTHAAGKMQEFKLCGRIVLIPNHSPWRYYYMVRNLMLIARAYFWQETLWISRAIFNLIKMSIKIALFEDSKFKKFYCMSLGVFDAFFKTNFNRF